MKDIPMRHISKWLEEHGYACSISFVRYVLQNPVRLMGFGTFKKLHRGARKWRNPQTGAEMEIAASDSLSFKSNVKY